MSALANYMAAREAAGYGDDDDDYYFLIVETPTRFFLIFDDSNGDYMLGCFVKDTEDYWSMPHCVGTLKECLTSLSQLDTLV